MKPAEFLSRPGLRPCPSTAAFRDFEIPWAVMVINGFLWDFTGLAVGRVAFRVRTLHDLPETTIYCGSLGLHTQDMDIAPVVKTYLKSR
jgi:hypothetical protein